MKARNLLVPACFLLVAVVQTGIGGVPAAGQSAPAFSPSSAELTLVTQSLSDTHEQSSLASNLELSEEFYCVLPSKATIEQVAEFDRCREALPECSRREWLEKDNGSLILTCSGRLTVYCSLPRNPALEQVDALFTCLDRLPDCDRRRVSEQADGGLILACLFR